MTPSRVLVAMLFAGPLLGITCYSEPRPPSNFRYACTADADCNTNETCWRGYCEIPCTQRTAVDDCPAADGYAACFNGICATTCALEAGYCPEGRACIDLGIPSGGGGNPFGGSDLAVGLCGIRCDPGDSVSLCPTGEICIPEQGLCAIDCTGGQVCPDGTACAFGICIPDTIDETTTDSGTRG